MAKKKSGSGLVFFALLLGIGLSAFLYFYQSNLQTEDEVVEKTETEVETQSLLINEVAPDFLAVDSNGVAHQLSSFKGKIVVLEWKNYGCPFVKKHYESGNMQALQKMATEKEVVWLSVVSSAEGEQGFESPEQTNTRIESEQSQATAVLIDDKGVIGKLYHAKVTPHMYIINQEGILVYQGAIDDKSSTDQADLPTSINYIQKALTEIFEGVPVSESETEPYGCSVKYLSSVN